MIELTFLKGIGVSKISASKECDVCHYWYFLNFSYNPASMRLDEDVLKTS